MDSNIPEVEVTVKRGSIVRDNPNLTFMFKNELQAAFWMRDKKQRIVGLEMFWEGGYRMQLLGSKPIYVSITGGKKDDNPIRADADNSRE